MISKILIDALRQAELFDGLSPMQITEIARHAERLVFPAEHVIARMGEAAHGALLIIDGRVECISGPALLNRQIVPAGYVIAEMAMFTEFEHGATFIARSPVKAMRISRDAMLAQMAEEPELASRLLDKVAGRLRQVAVDLAAAGGLDLHDDEDNASAGSASAEPGRTVSTRRREAVGQGHLHS